LAQASRDDWDALARKVTVRIDDDLHGLGARVEVNDPESAFREIDTPIGLPARRLRYEDRIAKWSFVAPWISSEVLCESARLILAGTASGHQAVLTTLA